jgi:hypothetical protein
MKVRGERPGGTAGAAAPFSLARLRRRATNQLRHARIDQADLVPDGAPLVLVPLGVHPDA